MADAATVLAGLEARADPARAADMARYHKAPRRYLGLANPALDEQARALRGELTLEARLDLARGLWDSDVYEARILAAKLLTQARIRPDDSAVWALIQSWVPMFDSWAISDHVAMAGQKRLLADPARLDQLDPWVASQHMWTRRAALVFTLGFTKSRHPKPPETEARQRILVWAAEIAASREWFLQKAVAWWLRDLSKRDPKAVHDWLELHGDRLKPFARKEAGKYL